ncbi:MAG: NAD(P)-dependent alcohol dehydrogenase [Anaerolineales bacterium]|nr:NAD(P)-dependent alcohol dehydrogenase [Anaerolineales bacterium]
MKAMVWTKYGPPDVLQLRNVEKPVPKDNEVLIRVRAASVSAGDIELRGAKFPLWLWLPLRLYIGLLKPKRVTILGQELAGEIKAVGNDVTHFKPGDQVFAWTGLRLGGYAEYACLSANGLVALKPADLTYEEAVTLPVGGVESLHFVRTANIQPGEKVLIFGAGGSIGTMAVQVAKHFGAEVTGLDRTEKLDMLRSIGAEHVIDYTQEDFTKNREAYDVIIDVIGKSPLPGSLRALKPNGRYLANPGVAKAIQQRVRGTGSKKVILGSAKPKREDFDTLLELIAAGKLKPVIDRTFPLEKTAEAHRYAETGHKKGNLILTIQ